MKEKPREMNRRRIIFQILAIIVTATIYLILLFNKNNIVGDSYFTTAIFGYQTGLFASVQVGLIYYLIKYLSAAKNEEKLREIYIEENDERTIMIEHKTNSLSMSIALTGLAFASVIAGFFNQLVFFSLLGALLFTGLIKIISYLYYKSKY